MTGPRPPRTTHVKGSRYAMTTLDCGLCGRNGVFTITRVSKPGEPSLFAGPCCAEEQP